MSEDWGEQGRPEEKLAIQIRYVNGVHVNHMNILEARKSQVLENLATKAAGSNDEYFVGCKTLGSLDISSNEIRETSEPSKKSGVYCPGRLSIRSMVLHLNSQSEWAPFPFDESLQSDSHQRSSGRKGCEAVPLSSSTRILFGEWTAGVGERDRGSLLLGASAVANVELCLSLVVSSALQLRPATNAAIRTSVPIYSRFRNGPPASSGDLSLSLVLKFLCRRLPLHRHCYHGRNEHIDVTHCRVVALSQSAANRKPVQSVWLSRICPSTHSRRISRA
jgi:hypothetical protein